MRIKGLSEGAGGAEVAYTTIGTLERERMPIASCLVSCIRVSGKVLRNIQCVDFRLFYKTLSKRLYARSLLTGRTSQSLDSRTFLPGGTRVERGKRNTKK